MAPGSVGARLAWDSGNGPTASATSYGGVKVTGIASDVPDAKISSTTDPVRESNKFDDRYDDQFEKFLNLQGGQGEKGIKKDKKDKRAKKGSQATATLPQNADGGQRTTTVLQNGAPAQKTTTVAQNGAPTTSWTPAPTTTEICHRYPGFNPLDICQQLPSPDGHVKTSGAVTHSNGYVEISGAVTYDNGVIPDVTAGCQPPNKVNRAYELYTVMDSNSAPVKLPTAQMAPPGVPPNRGNLVCTPEKLASKPTANAAARGRPVGIAAGLFRGAAAAKNGVLGVADAAYSWLPGNIPQGTGTATNQNAQRLLKTPTDKTPPTSTHGATSPQTSRGIQGASLRRGSTEKDTSPVKHVVKRVSVTETEMQPTNTKDRNTALARSASAPQTGHSPKKPVAGATTRVSVDPPETPRQRNPKTKKQKSKGGKFPGPRQVGTATLAAMSSF